MGPDLDQAWDWPEMPILDLSPSETKKPNFFLLGEGGRLPPSENIKSIFFFVDENKNKEWAASLGLQPGPLASTRPGPKASWPVPGLVPRPPGQALARSKSNPKCWFGPKSSKMFRIGSRIDGLA